MEVEPRTREQLLDEVRTLRRQLEAEQARTAAQTAALDELRSCQESLAGLLESAPDAVVISDAEGRITRVNRQAETMFGYGREELLGRTIELLVPERLRDAHAHRRARYVARPITRGMGTGLDLLARCKDGSELPVDIALSTAGSGKALCIISVLRDVSTLKGLVQERDALIARLQDTLARVKKLSGLLPICAACKRIRDDAGYWRQIEEYIREHSEAEFSHGLCPECVARLFSETPDP